MTPGQLAVILRRLDAHEQAIRDRDWDRVEFTHDQVLRAVQKAARPVPDRSTP